jgi:hypothetical protein
MCGPAVLAWFTERQGVFGFWGRSMCRSIGPGPGCALFAWLDVGASAAAFALSSTESSMMLLLQAKLAMK